MAKPNNKSKTTAAETTAVAPPTPASAASPATDAPVEHRNNPRIDEKIDEWIKRYPDQFKFFDEMPHERAVRKLVLNEINKYERQQKAKSYRQQEQHGVDTTQRNGRIQRSGNGMRAG